MLTSTEENYLKAIYKITGDDHLIANTNAIAKELNTTAASVTDMVKKLAKKKLLFYQKHRGVTLTEEGSRLATMLVRKHRLWEVFLVEKLNFSWSEVHEIAEQLEHIKSSELINRLDQYLGHPKFDPHGDPIPDEKGEFTERNQVILSELEVGARGIIVGVQEHSATFLDYLDKLKLQLGGAIVILEKYEYDNSVKITLNGTHDLTLTHKVSQNLFVQKVLSQKQVPK